MFDILPFPNITGTTQTEQLAQINNYLIQLKEELEFILTNIGADNLSAELRLKLNNLGAELTLRKEEQEDAAAQIKSKTLTASDVINSEPFTAAINGIKEELEKVKGDFPTDYIVSGSQTQTSEESGGVNIYTFKDAGGNTSDFQVRNGEKGDKGDKGDTGEPGARGPRGEKGDTPTITFTINFSTGNLEYTSA